MKRSYRILLIAAIIGLGLGVIGGLGWWIFNRTAEPQLTEEQLQLLNKQLTVLNSPYEKLLFMSETGQDSSDRAVRLLVSSFAAADTASLQSNFLVAHSNYLPEAEIWYSIEGQTIFQHTIQASIEEVAAPVGFTQYNVYQAGQVDYPTIGAAPANDALAWIIMNNDTASVVLHIMQSGEEQVLYTATPGTALSQITWSPTGDELAVVENGERVVMLDRHGAQLRSAFTVEFSDINYLTWISAHELATVLTSQPNQPQTFAPKVGIMNLAGVVTEEHALVEKVGVPRVLWSADSKRFLYYNPWKHQFLVYDRYDTLQDIIRIDASGRLVPFGWTLGELYSAPVSNPFEKIDLQTTDTNSTPEAFMVTAEEWDKYNATARAILSQFNTDFTAYRFATTDNGIAIDFALNKNRSEEALPAERVFIQTALQLFAVIPNLPTITLRLTAADGTQLTITDLRREQAEAVVRQFTQPELNDLFVIRQEAPYGEPVSRADNPNFNYLGDLYFSIQGDFNPYPALAALGATIGATRAWSNQSYALFYPNTWQIKDLAESAGDPYRTGDVVFYTGETEFLSNVSWQGFAVVIRSYDVPDVSLDQWLSINRTEYAGEEIGFAVHAPFSGRKLIHPVDDSLEYVLVGDHTVYALTLTRDSGVTDEDRQAMEQIVRTFSAQSAFDR